MVIFVVGVGETIFSDLKKIPERPISPSYCISKLVKHLENLTYLNCPDYSGFNEVDEKFGLDTKFNKIKPQLQEISSLNEDIRSNKREVRNLENSIQRLNKDYDLSLQEKMANENVIMDKFGIKNQITNSRFQISNFTNKIKSFERQRSIIISQITNPVSLLDQSYDEI